MLEDFVEIYRAHLKGMVETQYHFKVMRNELAKQTLTEIENYKPMIEPPAPSLTLTETMPLKKPRQNHMKDRPRPMEPGMKPDYKMRLIDLALESFRLVDDIFDEGTDGQATRPQLQAEGDGKIQESGLAAKKGTEEVKTGKWDPKSENTARPHGGVETEKQRYERLFSYKMKQRRAPPKPVAEGELPPEPSPVEKRMNERLKYKIPVMNMPRYDFTVVPAEKLHKEYEQRIRKLDKIMYTIVALPCRSRWCRGLSRRWKSSSRTCGTSTWRGN